MMSIFTLHGHVIIDNVTREEGDFYPYRYLASEELLPGYNFPALPVRREPA